MFKRILLLYFVFSSSFVEAKTYTIGLEPFPPFIGEERGGLTEDLLISIAKRSKNLKFEIIRAPYKRLKANLLQGKLDLIGHTPHGNEVGTFYDSALELNWSYPVCTEFLFVDPKKNSLNKIETVGTLIGNRSFLKEIKGMKSKEIFENSNMVSLLKMLQKGRLDAVWFARPVLNHYLQKLPGFKPMRIPYPSSSIPVGFAVQKNAAGRELKTKLEMALSEIEWRSQFDKAFKNDLECEQ